MVFSSLMMLLFWGAVVFAVVLYGALERRSSPFEPALGAEPQGFCMTAQPPRPPPDKSRQGSTESS